jgi:hypothetical protein
VRLGVESTELVDIPRVADIFTFKGLEAVGAWTGHLCNCEGTFPWRAELCSPFVFWMRRRTRSPTLKEHSLTLRSW